MLSRWGRFNVKSGEACFRNIRHPSFPFCSVDHMLEAPASTAAAVLADVRPVGAVADAMVDSFFWESDVH